MKYIEEANIGDCFIYNDQYFIITTDFKKSGDKLVICLSNGQLHWMNPSTMINIIDLFTIDKENNIIAIKERPKDAIDTNQNIS